MKPEATEESRWVKAGRPNLDTIEIDDKPRDEYTREERWAYLLRRVRELGHPGLIDKDREAERLDISRRQVFYDMEAVASYVNNSLGDFHSFEARTVFDKAMRECIAEGDWKGAVSILQDEADWLEKRGEIDKEAAEVNVNHDVEEDVEDVLNQVF